MLGGGVGVDTEVGVAGRLGNAQPERSRQDPDGQPVTAADEVAVELTRLGAVADHLYPAAAEDLEGGHPLAAPDQRPSQRYPGAQGVRRQDGDVQDAVVRLRLVQESQ